MAKTWIIVLIFSICINAQSFKLGFGLEAHQINVLYPEGTRTIGGDGLPAAFNVELTYNVFKRFSVQAKVGHTMHVEFWGLELGLNGKYNIIGPVFITSGIMYHSNEGKSIGLTHGSEFANIFMFGAGAGINVGKTLSLEADYYIPTSRPVLGGGLDFTQNGYQSKVYRFINMIRFGIHVGFLL